MNTCNLCRYWYFIHANNENGVEYGLCQHPRIGGGVRSNRQPFCGAGKLR